MLVLSRKLEETIRIGDDVVVKVIRLGNGSVKLGIEAPRHVRVMRGELLSVEKPEATTGIYHSIVGGVLSDQYPHVA